MMFRELKCQAVQFECKADNFLLQKISMYAILSEVQMTDYLKFR